MNGVNFFSWIRDGVRQSVLLGVSDAVEQLGTPAANEEIHPSVAGLFATRPSNPGTNTLAGPVATGPVERRRLGKSLKEMNSPSQPNNVRKET